MEIFFFKNVFCNWVQIKLFLTENLQQLKQNHEYSSKYSIKTHVKFMPVQYFEYAGSSRSE